MNEPRQNTDIFLCAKFTGTIDGRAVVVRDCFRAPQNFIGCKTDVHDLEIGGQLATNVRGCFCYGSLCNSATGIQATYLSLIAVTIHVTYKFVTAQ